MKKPSIPMIGFLQASGIATYVLLVGTFMANINRIIGPNPNQLGPVVVVMLFVVSALLTATMALGYPVMLFWDKKKAKDAIKVVVYTACWLMMYFLLYLVLFLSF